VGFSPTVQANRSTKPTPVGHSSVSTSLAVQNPHKLGKAATSVIDFAVAHFEPHFMVVAFFNTGNMRWVDISEFIIMIPTLNVDANKLTHPSAPPRGLSALVTLHPLFAVKHLISNPFPLKKWVRMI
jgi:hypothetical protein